MTNARHRHDAMEEVFAPVVFMPLRGATANEVDGSPLGRGKGRQALGWVVD
jgi:hypothetical protein